MICPNCGCKMDEEHLYCEKCGMEIRIVPDFDLEVENSITETLSTVAEEIEGNLPSKKKDTLEEDEQIQDSEQIEEVNNKKWLFISLLIFSGVILLSTFIAVQVYQSYSVSYQIQNARKYANLKKYDVSVEYTNKALELEPDNTELIFMLANYYYLQEEKQKAVDVLYDITQMQKLSIEEVEKAYGKIISIYDEQQMYQEINNLLVSCEEEMIQTEFQNYMAMTPEFSYIGGSYDEIIPLKLSANTTGNIYYTMDGSEPDEGSITYTAPIFLESGEYEIAAVFINEYGIRSAIDKNNYIINLIVPNPPEILQYSGEFTEPSNIEIVVPETGKVYYTTDGTDPNTDSTRYSKPIPLPLGKTSFKFVTISEEGVPSEIISRTYEFNLMTEVTVDTAITNVMRSLMERNILKDLQGHAFGFEGKYLYKYASIVEIEEKGYYYVLDEYYEDLNGNQNKSEHLYAVEVYTGSPNRLIYDENGKMDLIALN